METKVNELIQRYLTKLPGNIGFYYKNMVTGMEVRPNRQRLHDTRLDDGQGMSQKGSYVHR